MISQAVGWQLCQKKVRKVDGACLQYSLDNMARASSQNFQRFRRRMFCGCRRLDYQLFWAQGSRRFKHLQHHIFITNLHSAFFSQKSGQLLYLFVLINTTPFPFKTFPFQKRFEHFFHSRQDRLDKLWANSMRLLDFRAQCKGYTVISWHLPIEDGSFLYLFRFYKFFSFINQKEQNKN